MEKFWFEDSTYMCSQCGNVVSLDLQEYGDYYTFHCPQCGNEEEFTLLSIQD